MRYKNINDLLYNYFSLESIYYMLEKIQINFQSYVGLMCGRDHLLLLCEPL
jgi:hypothetical protein